MTVPLKARYVTCQYCNSQLHIVRNESAAWTEVVEAIEERTDALLSTVRALELRQEIQDLDAQWERTLDEYGIRSKDGHVRVPTREEAWGIAILWWFVAVAFVFTSGFPPVALLPLGLGIYKLKTIHRRAEELERLQVSHRAKRRALLDELRELGGTRETASPSLSGDSLPPEFPGL